MTDEQIRQNAETAYPGFEDLQTVYIEGAHSRDGEIEKWKNLCDRLTIEKRQLQKKLHNLDN